MTTDEGTSLASVPAVRGTKQPPARGRRRADPAGPSFWHRDHPVFLPLAGFFTGTLVVMGVLGVLGLVLKALFGVDLSEHPGPFLVAVLALLVLNALLLVAPHTRRFARYMLLGLIATPLVVSGVAAATLFVLVRNDG